MDFENLNDELKAKARACRTPEELLEVAAEEGYELTEEELESVSGGSWTDSYQECGSLYCGKNDCGNLNCGDYCSAGRCDLECGDYTTS